MNFDDAKNDLLKSIKQIEAIHAKFVTGDIGTDDSYIFGVIAVVFTPLTVWTLWQRCLVALTVDIVQQNCTGSNSEAIVEDRCPEFPVWQNIPT